MAEKNKKLEHIQVKDNGIKVSQKVGDVLAKAKQLLERDCFKGLLQASDETSLMRYRIAQNNAFEKYRKTTQTIIKNAKNEVKQALKEDKTVNLSNKQVVQISSQINNGLVSLGTDAMKAYQSTLKDIVLRVKSAGDLKEQLGKHIASGLNIGVTYKDGKTYQFDTYWEMKARTDIQQEIGNNMISTGQENGIIFYITSFYGDCAPDHAEYQGKIYVDEKWESMAPKDRLDEIRDYINSNKLLTVQEVTQNPPFLTTRPNCRHYFQYIDIDSVLGAKTKDDVNKLRDERNLNSGGKYKPEKYEALQKQRLNERKIRAEKKAIDKLEHELALKPGDKSIQSQIKIGEANVRRYQAEQRDLIKQYNNLERRYDREALGNRVTLGADKSQDLTFMSNESKIRIGKNPNSIMSSISDSKMEYVEVQKLESPLTSNQIVSKLMGKDETAGSCSSLALAYIGNKHGYDVTDYRGGESSDFFATPSNIRKIAEKYNGLIVEGKDEIQMVNSLLQQIDENKEYYVVCGEHASIIKNVKGKWKYAEFQDVKKIGFHKFDDEAMKKRFSCSSRRKFETFAIMVDIDNFNDEDFKNILGFINTKKKD